MYVKKKKIQNVYTVSVQYIIYSLTIIQCTTTETNIIEKRIKNTFIDKPYFFFFLFPPSNPNRRVLLAVITLHV